MPGIDSCMTNLQMRQHTQVSAVQVLPAATLAWTSHIGMLTMNTRAAAITRGTAEHMKSNNAAVESRLCLSTDADEQHVTAETAVQQCLQ